jgi:hypothetical protein
MLKKFERRESYCAAHEFLNVSHDVCDVFRHVLPASTWRLGSASVQIIHFIIHSERSLNRLPGQWRIGRALSAARAARAALRRMYKVPQHRIPVSAALEVLERLMAALEKERLPA